MHRCVLGMPKTKPGQSTQAKPLILCESWIIQTARGTMAGRHPLVKKMFTAKLTLIYFATMWVQKISEPTVEKHLNKNGHGQQRNNQRGCQYLLPLEAEQHDQGRQQCGSLAEQTSSSQEDPEGGELNRQHQGDPGSYVGDGRCKAVRLDGYPVFQRLPVRLRVL